MKFIETNIPDVKIIVPEVFGDDRGYFMETFRTSLFTMHCGERHFVQENQSKSQQGYLRGLHYQTENTQGKLVRVTQGEIFDVVVDLREKSSTFGHWVGVILSEDNKRQLWVPEGFAHGFYVMSKEAQFVYKCTDIYNPNSEVSIMWDDPCLNIRWPLINGIRPKLSIKDNEGMLFDEAPKFITSES